MYKDYSKSKDKRFMLKKLKQTLVETEKQLLDGIEVILRVFHDCKDDIGTMEKVCNDYYKFLSSHCRNMHDYYCLEHPEYRNTRKRKCVYDRKI